MLNKILSPLRHEDLKHAELQSMLHMSPLNRMLQESTIQDSSDMAFPTPQLLTVDALIKIKQSPRVTTQRQQQNQAQELQVREDWFRGLKLKYIDACVVSVETWQT